MGESPNVYSKKRSELRRGRNGINLFDPCLANAREDLDGVGDWLNRHVFPPGRRRNWPPTRHITPETTLPSPHSEDCIPRWPRGFFSKSEIYWLISSLLLNLEKEKEFQIFIMKLATHWRDV